MPTVSPSSQLDSFIRKYDTEVAVTARKAFAILRRLIPGAQILVYDNYNSLAIGFGPSEKASEAVISLAIYPKRVSLFFLQGGGLADPQKLLRGGSGKMARHIVIKDVEMLDDPAILELIKRTLKETMTPIDARAKGDIVIKSMATRQRPRRSLSTTAGARKPAKRRKPRRPAPEEH